MLEPHIMELIPPFSCARVFLEPWQSYPETTIWIVLMGFFVIAACGLIGSYAVLRKMALLGDAISHSLLPGVAIAFLLSGVRSTELLFVGALAASVVAVFLIEWVSKKTVLEPDAAMGIIFTSFFAFGVVLITIFADHIDLDTECVLYGEIAFTPFEAPIVLGGVSLGPAPVVYMGLLLVSLIFLNMLFFKELLITTFDPGLALITGLRSKYYQIALTTVLAVVVVSAFKSVGAILVIGMLLFPSNTGLLLFKNLRTIQYFIILFAAISSILGYHLAVWLDCSIAGAMLVVAAGFFSLAFVGRLFVKFS